MKKILLTLGLFASGAMVANAQTSAIKLNVTSLTVGVYNGSFEHSISDKSSFQVGAFYASYGKEADGQFTGFGITPEYRMYLTGESMQGFFVAPYVRFQNYKITTPYTTYNSNGTYTYSNDKSTLTTFGGGVNVGYQWIFGEHFVLEPFLRIGYNAGKPKSDSNNSNVDYTGLGFFSGTSVLPGLNLGFAF